MSEQLAIADYVTIVLYFAVVLAVGMWATFRPNRGSVTGYFLAGKNMHWIPVGASIFASNVGAPMFIGLAGTAAASGFAVAIYEWHASYLLIALGWAFVPVYVASGAFTMPEYLKKRFGGKRLRIYLSLQSLVVYILINITAEIYCGAVFIRQLLRWNLYLCVIVILLITAIYTVAGGLTAVMYTDTLQTGILLIGAIVLSILSFVKVGGWEAMMTKYPLAAANYTLTNTSRYACGMPRSDYDHIWRDATSGDIPWTGALFGLSTLGMKVWCIDQLMVQRCLSAKNLTHAKAGSLLAAIMKILPFFFWVIPGMISRILYPDDVACADPDKCYEICGNRAGCTNIAYPLLVLRILPDGLRGLMLAALLAALMSTLTSIFNSASSMATLDIWRKIRKQAKEHELMIVGRATVLILVGLSIAWIPMVEHGQGPQLWSYLQAIAAYTAPPWCVIFLMALFWRRTTEQGAFWGLMAGLVAGFSRMVMDFIYRAPFCGSDEPDLRPAILKDVNFLHFAIILSVVVAVVTLAVSLCTKERPPEKLRRVTWSTRNDPDAPDLSDSDVELEDDTDEIIAANIRRKKTIGRKIYNWFCGISNTARPKLTDEELAAIRQKMTSISEDPKWKSIMNVLATGVVLVVTFLLGFFG